MHADRHAEKICAVISTVATQYRHVVAVVVVVAAVAAPVALVIGQSVHINFIYICDLY